MNSLPILVQNRSLALVEVDGQAVVTASDLARALEYKDERSVNNIFARNKASFRDFGVFDLTGGHQFDAPLSSDLTGVHQFDEPLSSDAGIYDLTRVHQIDEPCSPSTGGGQFDHPLPEPTGGCQNDTSLRWFDTALVKMFVPGRADGSGAAFQDVRVFTKRGALKVCMKSNQPKAVRVQDALIDLYEKVESGQLIGAQRFGRVIEALTGQIAEMKRDLAHLKSRPPIMMNLPDDTALPVSIERKRGHSTPFLGGFRHKEVRDMVLALRRQSYTYGAITAAVKEAFPEKPDRHVSRSAVHRFCQKARDGRLKEFGIDVTTRKYYNC